MAVEGLNPLEIGLRRAILVSYFFSFGLGVAHASINRNNLYPAVTLIPATFSFIFAIFVLYTDALRKSHARTPGSIRLEAGDGFPSGKGRIRPLIIWTIDLLLGVGTLLCLILTWIFMPERTRGEGYYGYRYNNEREMMLGTYATVPFMVSFSIHAYFVIRAIYDRLPSFSFPNTTCPHCHHHISIAGATSPPPAPATKWGPGDRKGVQYTILGQHNHDEDSLYRDDARQGQESGVTHEEVVGDAGADVAREISSSEVRRVAEA